MGRQIKIIETEEFVREVEKHITGHELEALRLLLASKPTLGSPVEGLPEEVLQLAWGKSETLTILYMVSKDLGTIYLLAIGKDDPGGPGTSKKDEDSILSKLVSKVRDVGIGIGIKELLEEILKSL